MVSPFERLLLTGAGGSLGRVLRPLLRQWARVARGIETVCLRIGSSFPEPKNPRMMVSYLSYDDLVELVRCALFTPRVDDSIIYGVSDNTVKWWDKRRAAHLGFHAGDSSRRFEDRFPASGPMDDAPEHVFQGGPWVLSEPIEP